MRGCQHCREFRVGRQRAPDEPRHKVDRYVDATGLWKTKRSGGVASQDQTRHVRHRPLRKTKRALNTSATQRPQRPLVSELRPSGPSPEKLPENSILRGLLFAFGVALGGAGQNLLGDQAGVLADRHFDLRGHIGIGFQERL